MRSFILTIVVLSAVNAFAAPAAKKSSVESEIKRLEAKVQALESSLKKYGELELRMKEANSAVANLNTEMNKADGEIRAVAAEIEGLKVQLQKAPAQSSGEKPAAAGNVRVEESLSALESEVTSIRQELARMQDSRHAPAVETRNTIPTRNPRNGEFKEAISSPWVGFVAFIISIIALFTPG